MDFKEMHDTVSDDAAGTPLGLFTPEVLHYSRLRDYARIVSSYKPETMIDLGAGYGELLGALEARGCQPALYVAVEGSKKVFSYLKEKMKKSPPGVSTVEYLGDIAEVCGDHEFVYDFCVMAGILAFVPPEQVAGYLSSAVAVTGGTLLFTFHDSELYKGKFHSHDMAHIQESAMQALSEHNRTLKATTILSREGDSQIIVVLEIGNE